MSTCVFLARALLRVGRTPVPGAGSAGFAKYGSNRRLPLLGDLIFV